MLELKKIKLDRPGIVKGLEKRGIKNADAKIMQIEELDTRRREIQVELDGLRQKMNMSAKEIGTLMRQGEKEKAERAKSETANLKQEIKKLEDEAVTVTTSLQQQLVELPNALHPSVPVGNSADDNEVFFQSEKRLEFPGYLKPHWEVAVEKGLIDWELGAKITGSGFPIYLNKGARLLRALIQFFLDEAAKSGYEEVIPPLLVNEDSGFGTGQLPDKEGQMYHVTADNLFLIPTAEVPITNLYRNEIVDSRRLPLKRCGYTPCFRREAGAHGSEVRGLNRLHQFDKVEIVEIALPEDSYARLEAMVLHVRKLLESLELPYRILLLCGGDTGFTSAKTFDFEVYSAGQKRWLEVSSVSNFETFQANRLKLRYKTNTQKPEFVHTLNGSALALPRVMAAILENNFQENGEITLPKVLWDYMGAKTI